MNEPYKKTIVFSEPRKGQAIMDAMQAMALESQLTYRVLVDMSKSRTQAKRALLNFRTRVNDDQPRALPVESSNWQKGSNNLFSWNEPRALTVGFSSLYPENHVVILTGEGLDKKELQPEAFYREIAVRSDRETWQDQEIYPIGGVILVEEKVNKIAADLEARLK